MNKTRRDDEEEQEDETGGEGEMKNKEAKPEREQVRCWTKYGLILSDIHKSVHINMC